jgi:hypothetical protein
MSTKSVETSATYIVNYMDREYSRTLGMSMLHASWLGRHSFMLRPPAVLEAQNQSSSKYGKHARSHC